MKKPKLKLGRPVLAGDTEPLIVKGKYLYPAMDGHYVLSDNNQTRYYYKVKPDLSAPPMNGDEVEVSNNGKIWIKRERYIGIKDSGMHVSEGGDGHHTFWKYVRFPQPSKREKVIDLIKNRTIALSAEEIADQIDQIYKEDS